jgi:tetratricopeptide (TPR) repeat protein
MKADKWLWALLPILVLAGWFVYRSVQIPTPTAERADPYTSALTMIRQGKLDEAERLLKQEIQAHPTEGKYHFVLGNVARMRNEQAQALKEYLEAILQTPSLAEAYNNAAAIYMLQSQTDEALTIIDTGLQADPQFKDLLFKKGQLFYVKGRYKEAIDTLEPLTTDASYTESYRFIGLSFLKSGNRTDAINCLQDYVNKSPMNAYGRSEVVKILGDLQNGG